MHELALCDAMLKMVRDISREQALEGVRSITVRVGTLSGVVPRFLTDCWTAVTDGTEYDGVPLRIETEAGRARCLDCGAEFVADVEALSCPDCGGKKLMPLSGRDMTIQEIEAYAHGDSQLYPTLREGIVFRNYEKGISFKCVDPLFLLKWKE